MNTLTEQETNLLEQILLTVAELKAEISHLSTKVENLENQLNENKKPQNEDTVKIADWIG